MDQKLPISSSAIRILFGVFLGVAVLVQGSVSFDTYASPDETEQGQNEEVPTGSIAVSKAIPSSPTQVNLSFDSYLLEEVSFSEEEERTPAVELVAPQIHKAIRILLSKIVAPNAP